MQKGIDAVADYSGAAMPLPAKRKRMQKEVGAREAAPPLSEKVEAEERQDEALEEMELAAAGLANLSRESLGGQEESDDAT
eukprot:CAMPEP_0182865200 /NCGR_PEP_ID=MMETSP0034_2-20130328/7568_1 /TAXON_ID=156128 /ORGANISM="Nephroselmis pyriformis, Strain CCMP717" /LENGTH=80 /DNA_ID=CAMNT_0024997489 /DNA_START=267 /DNA_END=505 /DNA_ORIENTATION=-